MTQIEAGETRRFVAAGDLVYWNLDGGQTPFWIGPLLAVGTDTIAAGSRLKLWDPKSGDFFWAFTYEVSPIESINESDVIGNE